MTTLTSRWQGRVARAFVFIPMLIAAIAISGNAAAEEGAARPDASANAPPIRHGSAFVDPLGFALFGPRLGIELGSGHVSVAAHARWFNAGLLAHSLFLNSGDSFAFSYGAGLSGRYYLADDLTGTHVGIAVEYLSTHIENASALIRTNSSYFVPYAEVGYRLPLGAVYADASAGFGYAFRLASNVEDLPGGSSANQFEAQNRSTVYGTASLDLGLYF